MISPESAINQETFLTHTMWIINYWLKYLRANYVACLPVNFLSNDVSHTIFSSTHRETTEKSQHNVKPCFSCRLEKKKEGLLFVVILIIFIVSSIKESPDSIVLGRAKPTTKYSRQKAMKLQIWFWNILFQVNGLKIY